MDRSPPDASFAPPEVLAWLDRLPVAAVWTDGERLVPNAKAVDLVGWPREALRSIRDWFECLYGDRAAALLEVYADHRENGFPASIEVDALAQDGTPRYLEFAAVRDAIGEVWLLRDRADEVRTAATARDLAQTLQALGDHVPGVLYQYRMGPDGRSCFPFATRGIRDIYGVDPEAVREDATPVFDALHPDDLERVAASIETSRREMSVWRGTYRVALPDGRTIWAQGEATPEAQADGSVLWHGYISDVTADRERHVLWGHAVQAAGYAVWSYEPDSSTFELRSGAHTILGDGARDGTRVDLDAQIVEEDAPSLHAALAQASTGDVRVVDVRVRVRADEGAPWIRFLGGPEAGPGSRLLGLAQNVDAEVRRAGQVRRLADIVGQAPSIVMLTDLDGRIEYVNEAFERVSGYRSDEVVGLPSGAMGDGAVAGSGVEAMGRRLAQGEAWSGEFVNRAKDGRRYVERAIVSPLRDEGGQVTHYVKLAEDVTAQHRMAERVAFLSERDGLTGLPNRATFVRRLAYAVEAARRHDDRLAVLTLDVDTFSVVNDSFGHEAGDGLLRQIAQRLRGAVRQDDMVARLGGDEFAVMLDRIADVDDVAGVVDKLRSVARGPFEIADTQLPVSFSIGVAVFPSDAGDAETLLGHADAALYRAKEAGPDEVAYYTEAMNARLHERVRIETALREGLAADELRLAYQPRVDMASGRIVSLEALARWTSPHLGEVPPGRFIPVAEASGFISELGRWVVRTAVARIAAFRDAGVPVVPIAVNLSARQFREPDLVDAIRATLAEFDVPAGLFEVELTESVFMSDREGLVDRVRALERLGVGVSIDDFGTAYSSLGRLKRLGVQSLKIDQGFVRDLGDDPEAAPNDAAIVRAVIALGDAMDLTVIAEGVETPAQRDFLLRHGCRVAQGYLFARPSEVDAVEAMLRAGRVGVSRPD